MNPSEAMVSSENEKERAGLLDPDGIRPMEVPGTAPSKAQFREVPSVPPRQFRSWAGCGFQ